MKLPPDLQDLNAAVIRATAQRDRPFRPGERSRPMLPLVDYLDERGETASWRAVAHIARRMPRLYNRFVGERYLRDVIVDVTARHAGPIDFVTLVAEVERRAEAANQWLIAVPLTNLLVPGGYALVEKNVAALGMSVQDPDWTALG